MNTFDILSRRRSGVLLHPTSLPGAQDHGDLGHEAYRFVEFLHAAGFSVWQTLPLGPTHADGSPYQCLSVHAGNPLLISLHWLADRDFLPRANLDTQTINRKLRQKYLDRAYARFCENHAEWHEEFAAFETREPWLDDYALFIALRNEHKQQGWMQWPAALRDREPHAMQLARKRLADAVRQVKFEQFIFFVQWRELREYAHRHGVLIFGDMPIFVAHDSADVWAHREYFTVDEHGQSITVAGVPPDYFSKTGQRWGNPLYNWDAMQADGFSWWLERVRSQLELFDLIRIDHFRGFEAFWEIDAAAETAMEGKWVKAPGEALLQKIHDQFHPLPLIAEDLGIITEAVDELRNRFSIPGMKILQFAFGGGAENPYLPQNYEKNCVVYTGTHDNDTTLSWFNELDESLQAHVLDYLGKPSEAMPWPMIRAGLSSVSRLCMIPMQDLLALGEGHRMNTPGTQEGNWQWRYAREQIPEELAGKLLHLNKLYGR